MIVIVGAQVVAYLLLTQLTVMLLELRARRLLRCCLPALWVGVWVAVALWLTQDRCGYGLAGRSGADYREPYLVRNGNCGDILRSVLCPPCVVSVGADQYSL